MLRQTCDDILPTSRTVYVTFPVILLKVAREAWTKFSAVVSFRGRRAGQPTHRSSVDSMYHQRNTRAGFRMQCDTYVPTNSVWSGSFTICFTLECCDSQSSTNPLQHHITVSFYSLVGEKEQVQIAQQSIWTFSNLVFCILQISLLHLVEFLWLLRKRSCIMQCRLTVSALGLTVQLAIGVGSNTWQSVSSRSTSSTYVLSPSG